MPGSPTIARRVVVYRAGNLLIIEARAGEPLLAMPPRLLADRDALVCDLPRVGPNGERSADSMRLRLPRTQVDSPRPDEGQAGFEGMLEAGSLRIVHLSDVRRRTGVRDVPVHPAWLRAACGHLLAGAGRPIRMAAIARLVRVHPVHLSRTFRRVFGRAMTRYVRELRLQRALEDILFTRRDLVRIAADQGFADQSHLTRVMRRLVGMTPAQLRKKARFGRS